MGLNVIQRYWINVELNNAGEMLWVICSNERMGGLHRISVECSGSKRNFMQVMHEQLEKELEDQDLKW